MEEKVSFQALQEEPRLLQIIVLNADKEVIYAVEADGVAVMVRK